MIPFITRVHERRQSLHTNLSYEKGHEQFSISGKRVDYQYPLTYPNGHYKPLMIIGEAPEVLDEKKGYPFCGPPGKLLDIWLSKAGLDRQQSLLANTFRYRPKKDDIRRFFRPKGYPNIRLSLDLSSKTNLYLIQHFRPEIDSLKKTILDFHPEVVVTLGQTPLWAILNQDVSITRLTDPQEPHFCTLDVAGQNVRFLLLPAYQPSFVLRTGDRQAESISIKAFERAGKILRPASL